MIEDPWVYFAQLHAKADSTTIDDTYWARDDALDLILNRIAAREPVPSEQQLDTLIGNRRRKHRMRRRIVETGYFEVAKDHHRDRSDPRHTEGGVGALSDASTAIAKLDAREQQIVLGLAIGHSHHEIAEALNRPVGTIKTWNYRAKRKMAA